MPLCAHQREIGDGDILADAFHFLRVPEREGIVVADRDQNTVGLDRLERVVRGGEGEGLVRAARGHAVAEDGEQADEKHGAGGGPAKLGGPASAHPIEVANSRTKEVQDDLAVAGAELHLSNTALEHSLPDSEKHGDVRKALDQNGRVEEKVMQAAEDLAEVTDLLEEEIAQRQRLERELARRPPVAGFAG